MNNVSEHVDYIVSMEDLQGDDRAEYFEEWDDYHELLALSYPGRIMRCSSGRKYEFTEEGLWVEID